MACSSSHCDFALSSGALLKIFSGESPKNIILQILRYKCIQLDTASPNRQYRLLLNDSLTLSANAVLDSRLNSFIYKRKLEKYTIFYLKDYTLNTFSLFKNDITCTDIEIITSGSAVNQKISSKTFPLNDNQKNLERNFSISTTLMHSNPNAVLVSHTTANDIDKNFEVIKNDQNLKISKKQKHLEVATTGQNLVAANIKTIVSGYLVNSEIKSFPLNDDKVAFKRNVSISMTLTHANGKAIVKSCTNTTDIDKNFEAARSNQNLEIGRIEATGSDQQVDEVGSDHNSEVANIHLNLKHNFENYSIIPITHLSPYVTKWKIKARVTYKTPIFNYSNKRQGKLFSFYLLDKSGEIKATAFDEDAEKFTELLDQNKVYAISNADVIQAEKYDCPVKHDFEIRIKRNTNIEHHSEDESKVPVLTFKFQLISRIKSLPLDSLTDIIGIAKYISGVKYVRSKYKERVARRHFILRDENYKTIRVTLWNRDAENFECTSNQVVAIRNAKVNEFEGIYQLKICALSMIFIDPNIAAATQLRLQFRDI